MMRETQQLEFKEDKNKTYLKTVTAFTNYAGGEIKFGIRDDGTIVGADDPITFCLDIENQINDEISPIPPFSIDYEDSTSILTLTVSLGQDVPYMYKEKTIKDRIRRRYWSLPKR